MFKTLYAELSWVSYVSNVRRSCPKAYNYGLDWCVSVFGCFDRLKSVEERSRYDESDVTLEKLFDFLSKLSEFYEYCGDVDGILFCHYLDMSIISVVQESGKDLNRGLRLLDSLKLKLEDLKRSGGSTKTVNILVQGAQELLIKFFEQDLKVSKRELDEDESIEEPKLLDDPQGRYISCGRSLGSGCNGYVNLYTDTKTGEKVAVKHLFFGTFSEEILRKMQQVRSDYVAKALDLIDLGNGKKGLVMELVNGGESINYGIPKLTDKNRLLDVCLQIAKAFKAFDDVCLYAGDMHAGNILLSETGDVKIIDYDCAAEIERGNYFNMQESLNQIGTVLALSNKKLFMDFVKKLGVAFRVSYSMRNGACARLKGTGENFKVLESLTFDEVFKILEDMKHDI